MVFSAEQTRRRRAAKTEPLSPDHAPEDSGISTCESDGEPAASFSEPEDVKLGSPVKNLLKLEENPEELLQLAASEEDFCRLFVLKSQPMETKRSFFVSQVQLSCRSPVLPVPPWCQRILKTSALQS